MKLVVVYFKILPQHSIGGINKSRGPRFVVGFPPRRPVFKLRSGHVKFVVDKVALGHVLFDRSAR
jgi:hypothetical protein